VARVRKQLYVRRKRARIDGTNAAASMKHDASEPLGTG
jgi:hypothetical protein